MQLERIQRALPLGLGLFLTVRVLGFGAGCEEAVAVDQENGAAAVAASEEAPADSAPGAGQDTQDTQDTKASDDAEEAEGERWTGDGISWVVPEGWTQQAGGPAGPRVATLSAGEGDEKLEVAITRFPGTVGGVLANVNRWRGQVGLTPITADDLPKETEEVEVAGVKATAVDLKGQNGQRMLAAMVPQGEQIYFVKMMGRGEPVEKQAEAFDAFVRSIRFPRSQPQVVKVIVLNFEPTVPSEDNRTLWDLFGWSDPRDMAAGYLADVEQASGGAVDLQIVEWRDLNEFPIFTDGFRYNPDQYVQNRRTNTNWHDGVADFYRIAEQQGLAQLVNDGVIDEIWMFGDHYFSLLGEAWMAGPDSFFINGPSFPDFPVDRAVAGYGFSYERGVAEMLHNMGHRTENHISRAYGGWNIPNPVTNWDKFTANVGQSNTSIYGIGSTHLPANGADHYDYANEQTVTSSAPDWVHYPNFTGATEPVNRESWGGPDYHRNYQKWFFGHLPRNSGVGPDGRQNNWYKYIYDFNSYRPDTGAPRDNEAILGAPALTQTSPSAYEFTLRFYDTTGIDPATLDNADVRVTGPSGFSRLATLVQVGAEKPTTAGTARTISYRVTPRDGSWDADDSGTYTVALRKGQVRDTQGAILPGVVLGSFRVDLPDPFVSIVDVNALVAAGQATVSGTVSDIGAFADLFDGNTASLYRTPNIDPAAVTVAFDSPQALNGFRAYFSHASGDPAYRWKVETAGTLADLDGATGSYRLAVGLTGTPSDQYYGVTLNTPITARYVRLTATRLTGDDDVHINEWSLLGPTVTDTQAPTAIGFAARNVTAAGGRTHLFDVTFADDTAVRAEALDTGDVRVTGPNGFEQTATFWGVNSHVNGSPRTATYFITAPGGVWGFEDNGTYTVQLVANEVGDAAGNRAAAVTLGTFTVAIPRLQTRPPQT